jgi:tetratricopeptide (TPR) repeat protein
VYRSSVTPAAHLALALLLAGPSAVLAAKAPPTVNEAAQAYVQGRLAVASSDLDVAAQRFDEALKAGADDGLQRRAMDVAIRSGNMEAAASLAARIDTSAESGGGEAVGNSLIILTRVASAAAARDWRRYESARADFVEPGQAGSTPIISTLLEAYGLSATGQHERALALATPETAQGIARSYLAEHRAHLLVLARRWPEAANAYAAIVAAEGANVSRLRMSGVAAALEAAKSNPDYRNRAIVMLGGGPDRDPVLQDARDRFRADQRMDGRKLGGLVSRPADGLALLFLRIATDLTRERATGPGLGFARLATMLAPAMPETWLVTAETLARSDEPGLAMDALRNVPKAAPWGDLALSREAAILVSQEKHAEALVLLQRAADRPDAGMDDWMRLADAQRRAGDTRASAQSYGRAIAMLPADAGREQAQLWFLRGAALESAGDWGAAEVDLRRAVELAPDNAVFLNYLGYSLLDRRLKIEEARGLIRRAFEAAPENGAIIDSMGWAEYVSGNYGEAVRLLERARAAEPADPTVADHLGDALWKAGRRFEARHAWASAAALQPEPKLAEKLARKLDFGLDIALAAK